MKTADKVRIGVVGVGHLGRLHVQQLQHIEMAHLVGFYDVDADRSEQIVREFGIDGFPSFDMLLQQCDALCIVTPTSFHYEYARLALLANRHVFIEKPITSSLDEADTLIALGKERNLKIQVGHIERFNPAILAIEPLNINPLFIESHRLANFNPRGTDVAVVLDLMIHDIDLILSFVHSPVKDVQASGVRVISSTEDIANCRVMFENGCVANVTASRISARNMRKMRFFQPHAYISVDFLEGFSEVYYLASEHLALPGTELAFSLGEIEKGLEKKEIRYARLEKRDVNPLRYELEQFCRAILRDTQPPVTAEDARRALKIAGIILEKIHQHTEHVKQNWGELP